jgi:Na+-translocating ferredoxin:NAD+ oxidoreductase RnfD subunit
MRSPEILLLLDALLAIMGVILGTQGREIPCWSIFGALAILGLWQLVLFSQSPRSGRRFRIESSFRATHYVQGPLQAAIYAYVSLYWDDVLVYLPLLFAQFIVGCLCDMLLAWSRGRPAQIGFAIVPVILSTNLFTWFHEQYFYCQLLMIALAFFSKEFLRWEYGGRRRHIFNPSAFPLSVVALLLLVSGRVDMTRGLELVGAFELPPNFYEVIFLLGLVTQLLFLTTPVSMGAVGSLWALFEITKLACGEPLEYSPVAAQVFLGLTFLVTDPATTPRSSLGRFLFGVAYGTGVFVTYVLLRLVSGPAYFDKLLVVPLLNLSVPQFDRCSQWIELRAIPILIQVPRAVVRFGWLGCYIVLFLMIDPLLKAPRTQNLTLLPPVGMRQTPQQTRLFANRVYCRTRFPEAFEPFGLVTEFRNLRAIRAIYHGLPPGSSLIDTSPHRKRG